MKPTSAKPINWPIADLLRVQHYRNARKFLARWQSGVETLSGYPLQKLRLELAPSVSDAFTKFNSVGARI
jgi:hypothetical protein